MPRQFAPQSLYNMMGEYIKALNVEYIKDSKMKSETVRLGINNKIC